LVNSDNARKYLLDRGIRDETQQSFHLGFAPDLWDGLVGYLAKKKIDFADAETAGLIGRGDRGGYYDRIRGRVVFPIFDVQDRAIGFGGRIMGQPANGQPKYWNSPETPIFIKSKTLYGLSRSRKSISDNGFAVIVEGYTDVIAAHQAGFANVVATLGTALTEEHVKTLARLAPLVILSFDADSAGLKAAYRAASIFEDLEVSVKALELPDGEDPDSLIRAGRCSEFKQAIENAMPMTEYRIYRIMKNQKLENDRDRAELTRMLIPVVASVRNMIERDRYIRSIVSYHPGYRYGASRAEEQIRQEIQQYLAGRGAAGGDPAVIRAPDRRIAPESADLAERHLLRALAAGDPELASIVLNGITPDEFVSEIGKALAEKLFHFYREIDKFDIAKVSAAILDEDVSAALTDIVMSEEEPLSARMLEDDIGHIKTKSVGLLFNILKEKIDKGEAAPEDFAAFSGLVSQLKGSAKKNAR
jgi:DNA primase